MAEPDFVDARGLAALAALLLWPGLLVVRAPWGAVPFFSISFWVLSWWWAPSGPGRSAFLGAAFLFLVPLSGLRFLKPSGASSPSRATTFMLFLSGACLVPFFRLEVAPGSSLPSVEATLAVWRDGFPATYEPLVPIPAFGAHAPGLPFLAADVSLLSGLAPHRAVALVSFASAGLLVIALGFLGRRMGRDAIGAVGVAVAAITLLLAARGGPAPGSAVLSAALALAAFALLVRGSGRSAAVAAGVFLAAAFTVEAAVASLGALAAARGPEPSRRLLALTLALSLAGPRLLTSALTWTPAEARAVLAHLGSGGPRALPDGNGLRAMAWIREHTRPLDRVCVSPSGPGRFLPAISHRAAVPAEVPPAYRDEAAAAPGRRTPCGYAVSFGALEPGGPRVVFAAGAVRIFEGARAEATVTSFDTPAGNPAPRRP